MTGYTIETDGTPIGTRIFDPDGNDISTDTYRVIIDVDHPYASIKVFKYAKDEEGRKHIEQDTGEPATEVAQGVLTALRPRQDAAA